MIFKDYYNYKVSEDGRIFSPTGKEKSPATAKNGYKIVSLYYNRSIHTKTVHRLVAELFIPIPEGYNIKDLCVIHKDGDLTNNDIRNLEWKNIHDKSETGFTHPPQPVEVTYRDGTVMNYMSMSSAAENEHVSILTAIRHANKGTPDREGRIWKRVKQS